MSPQIISSQQESPIAKKIITLEKEALERWNNGDPMGYIDLYSDDITYFDPYLVTRLDGKEAITKLYESIKGLVHVERYEILNPMVYASDSMAVLSFNLNSYTEGKLSQWNSTEVYRKDKNGMWKIIHSHWSLTKPDLK